MAAVDTALLELRERLEEEKATIAASLVRQEAIHAAIEALEALDATPAPETAPKPKAKAKAESEPAPSEKFAKRARHTNQPKPPRRWDYEAVARCANAARERGESMRRAVMNEFDCKAHAADIAISTARKKGHEIAAGDPGIGGRSRLARPAPVERPQFTLEDADAAIAAAS